MTPQRIGNWETRDHNGYFQAREFAAGRWGRWRYYVTGFGDDTCNVMLADRKGTERVRITPTGRIFVAGRWVGPRHYNH